MGKGADTLEAKVNKDRQKSKPAFNLKLGRNRYKRSLLN